MLQVGKFVISEIKYRLKFCYILPNSPGCEQKRRREGEGAQIEICFSEAVSKFHVLDIVVSSHFSDSQHREKDFIIVRGILYKS